ncbi:SH3 domain-containing protein [Pelagibius marinus]|uniref:SH3 domain-containing protein n=1 Tax=Pelagibius marinus TaxID=2762760 RepID=UPI001872A5D5|nr:SH3 domain-containing protein [Pelagibius marinus]
MPRLHQLAPIARISLLAALLLLGWSGPARVQEAPEGASQGGGEETQAPPGRPAPPGRTGLPLPRFVTLRADEVNLRIGPGIRYPIDWVYHRAGLPVEIIDEFDTWRRIRDWQGTEGWVHQSMVQGQRGILVTGKRHTLRRRPEAEAPGVALVDAGVVGVLERCETDWCKVSVDGYSGWLQRGAFYGLYPGEKVE